VEAEDGIIEKDSESQSELSEVKLIAMSCLWQNAHPNVRTV